MCYYSHNLKFKKKYSNYKSNYNYHYIFVLLKNCNKDKSIYEFSFLQQQKNRTKLFMSRKFYYTKISDNLNTNGVR